MLDQGDDARGHKPGRAHRCAAARDLDDLHDGPPGGDLDAPAGTRRDDLERLHTVPDVDRDLDPVASLDPIVREGLVPPDPPGFLR